MSFNRAATLEDVAWLYRMILGREPGENDPLEARAGQPLNQLFAEFMRSGEFLYFMLGPLQRGGILNEGRSVRPPEGGAVWLADAISLEELAKTTLRLADSWAKVFDVLLNSAEFCGEYNLNEHPILDALSMARLHGLAHFPQNYSRIGVIEEVMIGAVRGWTVDPEDPNRPSTAQLWVDGEFVAAAPCERFRRDVQDRFGGKGCAGFLIELPCGLPDHRPHLVELRDGLSGLCLWSQERPAAKSASVTEIVSIKSDLAKTREILSRIEQRLRNEERFSVESLDRYSEYYERIYRHFALENHKANVFKEIIIFMDVSGCDHGQIEQAIFSIYRQDAELKWCLNIVSADDSQKLWIAGIVSRLEWGGLDSTRIVIVARTELLIDDIVSKSEEAIVIFAPASGYISRSSISLIALSFEDDRVYGVYSDEDHLLDGNEDYDQRIHCNPIFKPDYDFDLLLQQPYVGKFVAVRAKALKYIDFNYESGVLSGAAALLSIGRDGHTVHHIGRVLYSNYKNDEILDGSTAWSLVVDKIISADVGTKSMPFVDLMGAKIPGAITIKRSFTGTASIIIPTHNGRELLEPCIDSIMAARGANNAKFEILIIDHQSNEAETIEYLESIRDHDWIRILPYDGEFNWALMNNLAASSCTSDVLVFLNNDTLVITPDWLDAMCSQAVRREVGVVGARLLYQDGLIQHAGFVWREDVNGFLTHEGVREPASDGGYLGRHALTHATIAVTGACMAVSRKVFQDLGGFDAANFPVEGNDVDLCLRAWGQGLRVLYTPDATLYHLESVSRGFSRDGEKLIVASRANEKLRARWHHPGRVDPWYNTHFSREAVPFQRLRVPQ